MGRLSVSILDTMNGRPGAGVALRLFRVEAGGERTLLVETATNANGRTEPPLLDAASYRTGSYDIEFQLGAYFRGCGAPVADPPFLDQVTVRLQLSEEDGNYLLPMIAAPWGYQLYRGNP